MASPRKILVASFRDPRYKVMSARLSNCGPTHIRSQKHREQPFLKWTPPSNGNTPTPSAIRVTPVCVRTPNCRLDPSTRPIHGQGPIEVNNLFFRPCETLCRNTCGPVVGLPADDMMFISTADGKECLIAVAIPGLQQAYMYRSASTLGNPWDQQCWQSIEDNISTCVQNGPNDSQFYEGRISWLNSERILPTEANQPEPSSTPAYNLDLLRKDGLDLRQASFL